MKSTQTPRPYFRVKDIFIILLVLAVGLGGFFILSSKSSDQSPKTAEIRINNQIHKTIELSTIKEPYEIVIEGSKEVVLEVSAEGVRFISSQCPDKLCVHCGLISSGQLAACLPAGVSVKVTGNTSETVDAVAG